MVLEREDEIMYSPFGVNEACELAGGHAGEEVSVVK